MSKRTEQTKLIGEHPLKDDLFSKWLTATDLPASAKKKHRELLEVSTKRSSVMMTIAARLIDQHLSKEKLDRLKLKRQILTKYGFKKRLQKLKIFPSTDKTKKGNFAEVILAEYLIVTSNLKLLVYRLRFNSNVDQSMKGDDVILFDVDDLYNRLIVGEAKFRTTPGKQIVDDLTGFLMKERIPISVPFVADRIAELGDEQLAIKLEELQVDLYKLKIPIISVGFLLSNTDASRIIEKYAESDNPYLVLISLGIKEPEHLVNDCFELAYEEMSKADED